MKGTYTQKTKCDKCDFNAKSKCGMKTHKSRTHDKVLDDTSEADNSSVTEKLPVLEMGKCNLFNFKFNTPKAFHGP